MRPCPQCGTPCPEEHQYCPGCGFPIGTLGSSEDKFVGQTLPGGYFILDLLSVGGMGRVYRAEQKVLGRTVAVKIIHPHLLSDENSAVRFMTEARAASQLNHPNSVSVIDFGRTDDGQPYLVMEFLRGRDLAHIAYDEGPLPFGRIVDVLRQALFAVSDAHELGIVHRDLKPENIILEPLKRGGDHVKVVDFGLAKLKADAGGTNVTSPGIVCGTPDYMAPEQGRGDEIDGRSDLYAVGVILFQLLTGRLPFEAESPTQVVMMHLSLPVPDPRQVAPERDIPQQLIDVVLKALEKEPADRYQDAYEFADALKAAIDAVAAADAPAPTASSPGPRSVGTMQCPACEAVVSSGKFCSECGNRLPLTSVVPSAPNDPTLPLEMVGRDEDLAWLEDRLGVLNGTAQGARIVGEPGAGKTRLLTEFSNRLKNSGVLVVHVEPDPFGCEVGYYSVRQLVTRLVKLEGNAKPNIPQDATLELGVDAVFGRDRQASSAQERRQSVAALVRWALAQAAAVADDLVIVAVDDLHRIDGPSRFAFADVLGEPPPVNALFIATHAAGFESGWSAEHPSRVLSGLPPPVVSRLLSSTRPGERLRSMGDGGGRGVLPMYVEQYVRFTIEGGTDPPSRLADLIADRIASLEPDARKTLQALAIVGDALDPGILLEILPSLRDASGALESLHTRGMLVRDEGLISSSHPLMRDIVLAGIPAGVRKTLHKKAFEVSEKTNSPLEARAQHAFYSQMPFQALLLLEQVAARATDRGDNHAAILALRRGLEVARQELARGELDDPVRAVLIFSRKLGAALTLAGNFSDADGVLREALDLAGPSGTDRAQVLSTLAQVAHGRQRGSEAMEFIDEAILVAKKSGARELMVKLEDQRRAWAS